MAQRSAFSSCNPAATALLSLALVLGLVLGLTLAPAAWAGSTSWQGDFRLDNDLAVFSVDLAAAGDISATTFSHSGGGNGAGEAVAAGGFAPVLTLFDGDGFAIYGNVGSANTCAGAGSFCWDASFTFSAAAAGHYTLVLSQDDNNVASQPVLVAQLAQITSAYSHANEPHYTSINLGLPDDDTLHFVRVDGSPRTGHWALDISAAAAVARCPSRPARCCGRPAWPLSRPGCGGATAKPGSAPSSLP